MTSTARRIARFGARFDASRLQARHRALCGRAFADTFAVAIAGRNEQVTERALRYVRSQAPAGPARLWGTGFESTLEAAALFNGVAAHALDYDDASSPMSGHPSVVLLPALVALAQARALAGEQIAAAYVVGFEVACRLGRGLAQVHYDRGWHMTSTIGAIAAAVASGKLLGLEEDRMAHALGLAWAQAAGSRASFGTDAKPFQAGHAAASGLRAALLAEAGMTGAGESLDGKAGFTALYSGGEPLADAFATLGEVPLEIDATGIEVKKYPACYAVHRALDGLFDLKREHGLAAAEVAEVRVQTSYGALSPLITHLPATPSEARFSMQYAVAAALVDGAISLESFSDEALRRPEVRALMPKVSARELDGAMTPRWASVEVHTTGGQRWSAYVETLRGAPERPLSDAQLQDKVADCLKWGGSRLDARELMERALSLDFVDPALLAA